MKVKCPTDSLPEVPIDELIGCGFEFEATPDEEGIVDCPNCGMWFKPETEKGA